MLKNVAASMFVNRNKTTYEVLKQSRGIIHKVHVGYTKLPNTV